MRACKLYILCLRENNRPTYSLQSKSPLRSAIKLFDQGVYLAVYGPVNGT